MTRNLTGGTGPGGRGGSEARGGSRRARRSPQGGRDESTAARQRPLNRYLPEPDLPRHHLGGTGSADAPVAPTDRLSTRRVFLHIQTLGVSCSSGAGSISDAPVALALIGGLDAVLHCQQGIIRRDQALAAGVAESSIDSLVARGRWSKVLPRTYSVGADLNDPIVRIRAGWLWAGRTPSSAGRAAALWHRLCETQPAVIDLVIPPSRRMSRQRGYAITRAAVHDLDRIEIDRVAVTSPASTCLRAGPARRTGSSRNCPPAAESHSGRAREVACSGAKLSRTAQGPDRSGGGRRQSLVESGTGRASVVPPGGDHRAGPATHPSSSRTGSGSLTSSSRSCGYS